MNKPSIDKFKNDIRFRDKIAHIETIPSKEANYQKVNNISSKILNYLENENLKLYKHQAESFNAVKNKENIIITTPTASGKTLAFNLPVLNELTMDNDATALYIYPAKALSHDQLSVLKNLEEKIDIDIYPATYDGDTPRKDRPNIKKKSRIVLTNPYELHLILPWHHQWKRFYSNLKFIIIDEAHSYRGIFGSNVAFLIRRLKRIANFYGSDPVFILSTATLANPKEFATRLTGEEFRLINKDTAPSGEKDFVLYNPYKKSNKLSIHQETERIFLFLLLNNLQTLCFTISRKMAEIIAMWAKKDVKHYKNKLSNKITAYRAGYLSEERRSIEKGLKNKDYLGVTCTNALELGINIGSLDAVIISGYPGTMISTWQQAGRAGRLSQKSLVVLIAFENQLDQYFMKNPEFFFDKPHENAIIDLHNRQILEAHIQCSAYELIVSEKDLMEFFDVDKKFIDRMLVDRKLAKKNGTYRYRYDDNPCFTHSLDQLSSDIFKVMHEGKLLEIMERSQVYREAHEGAVLINKGETYTVENINLKSSYVNVKKRNVEYHTQALKDVEINIVSKISRQSIGNMTIHFGELEVKEDFTKYKKMQYSKVLGVYALDLPPLKFKTKGLWFTIPNEIKLNLETEFDHDEIFNGSLHGAEHMLIALFPLHVMCDRFDIGGLSTNYHQDTQEATIFIYDAYEGGIGITEKAIEVFRELSKSSEYLVKNCECVEGCPSCIYSPKCGNENKPLHKKGTEYLLNYMNNEMEKEIIKVEEEKKDNDLKYRNNSKNTSKNKVSTSSRDEIKKTKSLETVTTNNDKSTKEEIDSEFKRAKKLFSTGDSDEEALNIVDNIIEIDENHVESYLLKFDILTNQKKYSKASETLEKLNSMIDLIDLKYKLAKSYYNEENYIYAKDMLSNIICIDKKYVDAYYLIGLILFNQEDYSGARSFLSRALSIDKKHIEAYELLEEIRSTVKL